MTKGARSVVAGLALVVALGGGASAAGAAYEQIVVTDGGTLSGSLRFTGTPPRLAPAAVTRQPDACGDTKPAAALVVGADGGVKGGVVLLEGVTRGKKPTGDVVIDTSRCQFVAHVSAATIGERVRVKTSDTVVHQPRGIAAKATVFNLALPRREQTIDVTRRLTRPAAVRMVCGAHPHMTGWLVVHDSPYYAVTDERGAYRIDGIPPGAYRVVLWHEGFRPRGLDRDGRPVYDEPRRVTKAVTIAPRGATTVDFELR